MPSIQSTTIELIEVRKLKLDLENPRFVGLSLDTEAAMVFYLYENADLSELLLSILNSGYMDFEPIVVRRGDYVVLEGNRRVAALRLISDGGLRDQLKIRLPMAASPAATPQAIRAVLVDDANQARRFIGFKHINGPQKWDAMSKAKYAADWHNDGASLAEISQALGDTFNTVTRLVEGYRVYEQALATGFNPDKRTARRFAFSHLYTALTRSSIKSWLGLDDPAAGGIVPPANESRLTQLMSWLYGQGDQEPALIKTQNPDLNRLADVVGNERSLAMLMTDRNLKLAHEELEPQSSRLENALVQSVRHTEAAAAIQSSFDGRASTFELGQRLFKAARGIALHFRDARDKAEGLDDQL